MELALNSARRLNVRLFSNIFRRKIMTSATRCEKVLEELKESNPYFEKYASKIAKLQETSPEELLSRLEKRQKDKAKPKCGAQLDSRQYSQLLKPKGNLSTSSEDQEGKLSDIMKIDLIKDKTTEDIRDIWEAYHIQKTYIAAVIPAKEYDELQEKAKQYPTFIFPLPRSQGYEFIVCQFAKNTIHFTPLLCYQVHKENAPECLKLTYYSEFKDDKEIVLMRGEFDNNVLDSKEALCLANQLVLYYGGKDVQKWKLVEQFNNTPDKFKHTDLIKQIENLSL